ncbi:carboxypeptidase-like regulatory domain-containing protein [Pyxidicoccus xibeiensis]|uniref:carboxypeptidase-like regulatory domain-containing protein n=1 Tax=Pyxidicoccus xibeiensis TaxID=2906759 RepID=UPI00389AFD19
MALAKLTPRARVLRRLAPGLAYKWRRAVGSRDWELLQAPVGPAIRPQFALLLLLATACDPVWDAHGRVVDCTTSRPVTGAKVVLVVADGGAERRAESTSDERGAYWVQLIAEHRRPATMSFSKPGYEERVQRLQGERSLRDQPEQVCLTPLPPSR